MNSVDKLCKLLDEDNYCMGDLTIISNGKDISDKVQRLIKNIRKSGVKCATCKKELIGVFHCNDCYQKRIR